VINISSRVLKCDSPLDLKISGTDKEVRDSIHWSLSR